MNRNDIQKKIAKKQLEINQASGPDAQEKKKKLQGDLAVLQAKLQLAIAQERNK